MTRKILNSSRPVDTISTLENQLPTENLSNFEKKLFFPLVVKIFSYLNDFELISCFRVNHRWRKIASHVSNGLDNEVSHIYGDKEPQDHTIKQRYSYVVNPIYPEKSVDVISVFRSNILNYKYIEVIPFQPYKHKSITYKVLFFTNDNKKQNNKASEPLIRHLYEIEYEPNKFKYLSYNYSINDNIENIIKTFPYEHFIYNSLTLGSDNVEQATGIDFSKYRKIRLPIPKTAEHHISWQGEMSSEEAEKLLLESEEANYLLRGEPRAIYLSSEYNPISFSGVPFHTIENSEDYIASMENSILKNALKDFL